MLEKCPECGREIGEKEKKCSYCGLELKKRRNKWPLILITILIVVGISVTVGFLIRYNAVQKQEKIETLLSEAEKLYLEAEFEEVQECYEQLEKLGYDISANMKILEYDMEVYDTVWNYYTSVNTVYDKLCNKNYHSLESLIKTLEQPTTKFKKEEINMNSKLGEYINEISENPMFIVFNDEFIYNDKYDLDYYLTSSGYVIVIKTYLEEILKEEFPYVKKEEK